MKFGVYNLCLVKGSRRIPNPSFLTCSAIQFWSGILFIHNPYYEVLSFPKHYLLTILAEFAPHLRRQEKKDSLFVGYVYFHYKNVVLPRPFNCFTLFINSFWELYLNVTTMFWQLKGLVKAFGNNTFLYSLQNLLEHYFIIFYSNILKFEVS